MSWPRTAPGRSWKSTEERTPRPGGGPHAGHHATEPEDCADLDVRGGDVLLSLLERGGGVPGVPGLVPGVPGVPAAELSALAVALALALALAPGVDGVPVSTSGPARACVSSHSEPHPRHPTPGATELVSPATQTAIYRTLRPA